MLLFQKNTKIKSFGFVDRVMIMLTYQTFMKHADKVIKTASESKAELHGVYHHKDGSLVVTDSFRLYKVFRIEHDKELGSIYTPKGKKIDNPYPNTDRLVQIPENSESFTFETKEMLRAVDVVTCAPISLGETPIVRFKEHEMMCQFNGFDRAFYKLPIKFKESFVLNGQFLLDALKLLKAAKCKEFSLLFTGRLRPIFLVADNITILIMPIRIY